jgi:signal transduction histidine kinase/ABC-type nitrate/sulfonate/bicarbonate transport system substrate-binding protein
MKDIIKILLYSSFFVSALFSQNLEKVFLQLQWLDQFQFAGYYMAKERGFYKDVGLDVEFRKFNNDIKVTKEVINNEATYGIGRSSLLVDKSNGANIKLLASIFQSSPSILIALKDSNITKIEDFKNKKMMSTSDATSTASFLAMGKKYGVDKKDIIFQKHSFDIDDLVNKKTDLMASYISNEPFLLKQKGIDITIFDPKDYGFDFYSDILFTSNDEIDNHRQRAINFRNASIKGWEYAFNYIEETVELILKKYNPQHKSKEALLYEAYKLRDLAYYKTQNIGIIETNKLQRIYDIYNVIGLIKHDINIKDFVLCTKNNKIHLTKEEKSYLNIHKILRVDNEANLAPFNYNENGIAKGFSMDYMNLLAKKLNIKISYVSGYSWSELMKMLQTPQLDIISNIVKTKKREKSILFTDKFYTLLNAIYINKKSKDINTLKDLEGKTIAIEKGFYMQEFLSKNYPLIKQIVVKKQIEALSLLSLGKVDAVVGEKIILDNIIESRGLTDIFAINYVRDLGASIDLSIGVSKKDAILKNILQKAKDSISKAQIKDLKSKWFGVDNISIKNNIELTKKEKQYLEKNRELKICVLKDRLPYEGIKNGKYIGISADFLNLFFKNLSISYKIIEVDNQVELMKLLNDNRCDIKPILSTYKKININYVTTEPYFKDSISLVTRIEQPFMNDLNILSKEKILIHKGFNNLITLVKEKYPNLNIQEVDSIKKGLNLVLHKKAFGYIGTSLVSSLYIQKNFPKELKISNSFNRFDIGFGILKDDLILLNILNKYIKKIDEIEKNRILNRWVATIVEVKQNYNFIWKLFLLFSTILLFLLYFNFKQKKLKNKLKNLNENLEMRVKKEVEINRIKDQQLQAQSRLAQMGEMISMIAHQWRQPLTAISATTSNLKFKIMMGEIDKKVFEKEIDLIDNYTQHLSNTIDDFRGFFKEQTKKEKTTLVSIIKSTLDIVQVSVENKNIKIVKNFICQNEFETNVSEVKQVLLNLIKNAEDILLEKNIKNPTITIESRCEGNKIFLSVRDNGGGVPPNIKDNIFDPYFSTKKVKDGTGLGLYMSKTIIEEHCGGKLNTYNDRDGAVFIIEFDEKF